MCRPFSQRYIYISKWETDTSVPELDKLIQLGEVFHITLDELVKGDTTPAHEASESAESEQKESAQSVQIIVQKSTSTRVMVGMILLCFGAVVLLLLTLLGGVLTGLLFSVPFLLCGTICLVFKQNAGLWCAWALLFAVNVFLRYATGISWNLIRFKAIFEPSMNYMRLAFAWIELLCYVAIVAVTVLRFRKKLLEPTKKTYSLLVLGCIAVALSYIPAAMMLWSPLTVAANLYFIFGDWIRLVLLTVIFTAAARLHYGWKRNRGKQK